jgi:hypothetical protein
MPKAKINVLKKKGYFWVTLALFLISMTIHWICSWEVYKDEQEEHNKAIIVSEYVVEALRDTMENWQSEFLQLIWQVVGLSFLWYVGSPDSKEGDDRKEEKMDEILRLLDPENAEKTLKNLEKKYPKE